jgi:hypothetical protein
MDSGILVLIVKKLRAIKAVNNNYQGEHSYSQR